MKGFVDLREIIMQNLLEKLNKEQLKAVTYKEGPLLIIAGAGTGKTTVITERVAYIIKQNWAGSDEILALTFTEKAAGEMEERVDKLLPIGYLDLWISTFHSFGERILKEHGLEIGLPSDFKLLNEFEQWALIKKNLDRFDLDYYRPMGNPTKFIHALVKHFSRAKDEDISPKQYLEYSEELKENMDGMLSGGRGKNPKSEIRNSKQIQNSKYKIQNLTDIQNNKQATKEIVTQEVSRISEVANAYHAYQQLLLDNNALDFGDLINYCLKLFRERPVILEKYRQQFKYILLDEFQDTNWAQYELIKMLAAPKNNLVVVCDDDQAIFRFRGASMSNMLQFRKDYPGSKNIVLVNNYRNKQNILDLSYEFIKLNNPNRLEYQFTKSKEKMKLNKKLVAKNISTGMIEVIRGKDLADEVRQVVEKIADIKIKDASTPRQSSGQASSAQDKNASWNDFAVLVRANESAKDFCNALEAAGLPYQFLASRGLYTKPVIMDVVAYLKMLDNYHESPALYRVLNLPIFNFSYHELVNFNYWANKKSWSLYEVLRSVSSLNLGAEIQTKVDKVLSLIDKHTALVRDKSASEVVLAFLNDSGYLRYLTSPVGYEKLSYGTSSAGDKKLSHRESQNEQYSRETASYLNQFMKRIQTFEAGSDNKSIKAFLEELNMEISAGEEGALSPDIEAGPEMIKIITVHGAKGLEFKYVFITNLVDKRFPTTLRKEPIQIPDALIKEILPVGDIHLEEERRLFYVAMTRAKKGLFFSWAPDYGGMRKKKPSRFLVECNLVKDEKKVKVSRLDNKKKAKNQFINFQFTDIKKQDKEIKPNIPLYFSYTQLAAFSHCPYQYRFAHILKIPRRGKATFSFGKTMHAVLQKLFTLINKRRSLGQVDLFEKQSVETRSNASVQNNRINISFDEILGLYEQSWIDDWYEGKLQKEEYKKKGKEILKEFYAKHKDNWPHAVYIEKGFNIKILLKGEQHTIRGVIDRIDEIDGKLKIIDYKTGQPKEKLDFKDKEQLLIYQMAVQDLFKQEIASLAFYFLENNSLV